TSVAAQQTDQSSLNLHPIRREKARLISLVGGLKGDSALAAAQPLQGDLFAIHQGDDDRATLGRFRPLNQDGVAVKDSCLHHGVPLDLKGVVFPPAQKAAWHLQECRLVAQCFDWGAGCYSAIKRQRHELIRLLRLSGAWLTARRAKAAVPAAGDHIRLNRSLSLVRYTCRSRAALLPGSFIGQAQDLYRSGTMW